MFQRALARKAAILVGYLNQASDLAKQQVLVGIKHAVGEGHLPEHLDDLDPLLGVEAFADLVGEGKVLGRILNPALGLLDKLLHGFGSEIEYLFASKRPIVARSAASKLLSMRAASIKSAATDSWRDVLKVGRARSPHESLNLARVRHMAAQLGATEVHILPN